MMENLENRFGRQVDAEVLQAFAAQVRPAFERFKDIGVRIEDIVLITEDGHDILSKEAPKEPNEIESLMKKKSSFK
jgi:hypothetical protein